MGKLKLAVQFKSSYIQNFCEITAPFKSKLIFYRHSLETFFTHGEVCAFHNIL